MMVKKLLEITIFSYLIILFSCLIGGVIGAVICFSSIIFLIVKLLRNKAIQNVINLEKEKDKFLCRIIKTSDSYKKYKRILCIFPIVWSVLSAIYIFMFTTVWHDWALLGWSTVLFMMVILIGIGLMIFCIIFSWLECCFPNIEEIFKEYGLEIIKTDDSIHHIWKRLPPVPSNYHNTPKTWLKQQYEGFLPFGSKIKFEIKFTSKWEFIVGFFDENPWNRWNNCIELLIHIDIREILLRNNIDVSNITSSNTNLRNIFPNLKTPYLFSNIEFCGGVCVECIKEEMKMNAEIVCGYLISVLKACQELENTFNSLA